MVVECRNRFETSRKPCIWRRYNAIFPENVVLQKIITFLQQKINCIFLAFLLTFFERSLGDKMSEKCRLSSWPVLIFWRIAHYIFSLRVIHQKDWLQFFFAFFAPQKPEATLNYPLLCGFLWPEIVLQFAFQICSLLGPEAAAQSPLQVLREFPLQFLREFLLRFFLIRNCNKTKS